MCLVGRLLPEKGLMTRRENQSTSVGCSNASGGDVHRQRPPVARRWQPQALDLRPGSSGRRPWGHNRLSRQSWQAPSPGPTEWRTDCGPRLVTREWGLCRKAPATPSGLGSGAPGSSHFLLILWEKHIEENQPMAGWVLGLWMDWKEEEMGDREKEAI